MGIKVTLRRLSFPEWVQKAFDDMHPVEKEDLVKAMIYSQITPLESGEFEISKVLQEGSNRVPILEDIGHCMWSLGMATTTMAWSKMDERNEVNVIDDEVEKMTIRESLDIIGENFSDDGKYKNVDEPMGQLADGALTMSLTLDKHGDKGCPQTQRFRKCLDELLTILGNYAAGT